MQKEARVKRGMGTGMQLSTVIGGRLNPNFVEFLMGFPLDWTKVESKGSRDLETP